MNISEIYDIKALMAAIELGYRPEYLFFWSHNSKKNGQIGKECLSQWFASSFIVEGITYPTAEHFMMAEKARLFGDEEIHEKILSARGPDEAKKFGRLVRNFDVKIWSQHCFDIVIRGNEAKFGQNNLLKTFLVESRDTILVEASPFDPIWGIGLDETHPNARVPKKWEGRNKLGFALMLVRSKLLLQGIEKD